jgi:hypothetical protein
MNNVINARTLRAPGNRARIARVITAIAIAGLLSAACGGSTDVRTTTSLTLTPTTATGVDADWCGNAGQQ